MSLKILLADDSMTAQNMGKKILADAGFEVIACSNGAAAVKKIAETKPDIIILDIYMPGYTGLEVCDKVKAAPETANVPVLLTVGKLEPYRPEEGAKVKAEGVIIKPFEASDLLTALGKIAQKYNLKVPQIEPIEIKPREHVELPHDDSYRDWKKSSENEDHDATVRTEPPAAAAAAAAAKSAEPPVYEKTMRLSAKDLQAMLDKGPSEAAKAASAATVTTPAIKTPPPMQTDPNESTQKLEVPAFVRDEEQKAPPPAPVVAEPEAPPTPMFAIEDTPAETPLPSYMPDESNEIPAYMIDEPAAPVVEKPTAQSAPTSAMPFSASSVPDEEPTSSFSVGGLSVDAVSAAPETTVYPGLGQAASADAVSLDFSANTAAAQAAAPVHHELETFAPVEMPEVHHVEPELETTAAAKVDTHVEHLMELETTHHQEQVEVAHVVDPALVTTPDELMQFTVKVGTEKEEPHVDYDPLAKEQMAALYTEQPAEEPTEKPHPPTEEMVVPQQPEAAEVVASEEKAPHSYQDDPMVQMGVISVESTAPTPENLAEEFNKPVTEDEPMPEVISPASGVVRALQEYETHAPTDEAPVPEVIARQMQQDEAPPIASPVPEPAADDENMKKFATELHEAIAFMPSEPHVEPEHVPEPAAEAEAPAPIAGGSLAEKMAAANPAFSDALPLPAELQKEKVEPAHDHELAASLSAALDNVAKERSEGTKSFAVAAGMETTHVAKAVQRVFERYKEQMIADIADELSKEQQ